MLNNQTFNDPRILASSGFYCLPMIVSLEFAAVYTWELFFSIIQILILCYICFNIYVSFDLSWLFIG